MRVLARDPRSGLPALVSASPMAWTAPHPALSLGPPPGPSCSTRRGCERGRGCVRAGSQAPNIIAGQESGEKTQSLGEGPGDTAVDETPALCPGEVPPPEQPGLWVTGASSPRAALG